jgi:hypothetical protein
MNAPTTPDGRDVARVILFELNEVTLAIIEDLAAAGRLPNFARLNRTWTRYATTSEERQEWLEPWIQWPTVHTGKSYSEHGLFKLGDSGTLRHEQIWERLWDHGIESCVIGNMNAARGRMTGGIFIPDWWGSPRDVHPPELLPLWTMLSSLVQGHATAKMTPGDILTLLRVTRRCGLPISAYTDLAWRAAGHLVSRKSRWKSAGALDLLVFRLFSALWKRGRFGFGSVFLNAVAHYQHHYWRSHDPALFASNVSAPDVAVGDDPIKWGYVLYDRIIGEILQMAAAPDVLVIVATGLSQAPYLTAEATGGERHYRVIDLNAFLTAVGLEPADGGALMSRDMRVNCHSEADMRRAQARLQSLMVAGEQLFNVTELSNHALATATRVSRQLPDDAWITDATGHPIAPFARMFQCTAIKSGNHNGVGTAWLSRPVMPSLKSEGGQIWLGELFEMVVGSLTPRERVSSSRG